MDRWIVRAMDVDDARKQIFNHIRDKRDKKVIYFGGYDGFGIAPVLRSIAQVLPSIRIKKDPPELCFDKILYIDCSIWISERDMQKKIAEELELDKETIAMFDKQDEDDDFTGLDHGSRDIIRSVSEMIVRKVWSSSLIMIFLNGSDHEIDVSRYGIIPNSLNHVVVWTFKRQNLSMHDQEAAQVDDIYRKLRYTHLFLWNSYGELDFLRLGALLHDEAATLVARNPYMQDIDLTMITNCWLYSLFIHYCFLEASISYLSSQAPNCMLCDGFIKGEVTRDTTNALHSEINWESYANVLQKNVKRIMKDPNSPFLIVKDGIVHQIKRHYCWVWISSISQSPEFWRDMQTIFAKTSTCFIACQESIGQQILPNGLFEQCNNIQVLILSCCTFNFVSPPFHRCNKLRFLGLDHCIDNKTNNVDECMKWAFLNKLWTLDMHYTHWDEIITEEKMDLMTSLQELNIEGFCCWQYICKLRARLCNLKRLRIIKPIQQVETLLDCNSSFIDNAKLEILDLSGNRDMKNLSASLSKVSKLHVLILDDCGGLENVVVSNGLASSISSFSFDGYGPATLVSTVELPLESSRPKCTPSTDSMYVVRISKISLQGCTKLENLFVRGLPNLEELDLSGNAIKVLNFDTMVTDVPRLRRLFLLGCHHLRAILWGKGDIYKRLELICLDTRAGRAPRFARPSLVQHIMDLQLHAILADARLFRSLFFLTWKYCEHAHFNIHVTSSTEDTGTIEPVLASEEMIGPSNLYDGVLTKIGDASMLAFPEPPTQLLDCHMEFSDGSLNMETELASSHWPFATILTERVQSLHVHDFMINTSMPKGVWFALKWCRIERCPNLDTIFVEMDFPYGAYVYGTLETIWVSDLLMVRSICSKGFSTSFFGGLQHLHLHSCPRLEFVLLVTGSSIFAAGLETIHIIRCGDLRNIFLKDHREGRAFYADAQFPKLTTIHLHDLPKLQQICEVKMLAPALETIKIRGRFGLRCLPAVAVREPGQRRPTVEIEKDMWDALEWDKEVVKTANQQGKSVDVGHSPDLFEPPVHSRYYKKRHIRGTVLR